MKAALLTELNAPLEIREIGFSGPQFGQVAVRILTAGICGAQLQEIHGEKGGPIPHTMGHEGCGIVEAIGEGVTRVKEGDKVVLHWRKAAGIESDFPTFITDANSPFYTTGKVTTWAQAVVVSENRVTPVSPETDNDLCTLLGCGLSTALATVENEAGLKFGQSVMIVGTGGLGVNLIRAAKFAHAFPVVACDCYEHKRQLAFDVGADDFCTDASTYPGKFDCVIDTSGNPEAMAGAWTRIAPSGKGIMIGQPPPEKSFPLLNARHFFDGDGKTLLATQGGGYRPDLDIPRYVRLWKSGALKLDGLITHRLPLSEINTALEMVRLGEAGRIIIDMTL